jgi:hypothetical protein
MRAMAKDTHDPNLAAELYQRLRQGNCSARDVILVVKEMVDLVIGEVKSEEKDGVTAA